MSQARVFVDGHVGTTGLVIHQQLAQVDQIDLLTLNDRQRKDPVARQDALNQADLAVLCLPDEAAREAVAWIENPATRVLDASSAHRVAEGWTYGLAELAPDQRQAIADAARVANPGCYPNTPILLLRPLIDAGLLPEDLPATAIGLSGYSGGGTKLIERWENPANDLLQLPFEAPYALDRVHKHIAEINCYSGLRAAPQFIPAVGPFRCGMRVHLPLHASVLPAGVSASDLWGALNERYAGERFVTVAPFREVLDFDERSLDPRAFNGTNTIELAVLPNAAGSVVLMGRLDNLGKGAGGAALQNINIMLGLAEDSGLVAVR